jgi:hypothetical protein
MKAIAAALMIFYACMTVLGLSAIADEVPEAILGAILLLLYPVAPAWLWTHYRVVRRTDDWRLPPRGMIDDEPEVQS